MWVKRHPQRGKAGASVSSLLDFFLILVLIEWKHIKPGSERNTPSLRSGFCLRALTGTRKPRVPEPISRSAHVRRTAQVGTI